VLAAAKRFFARSNNIYAAYVDMEGPNFISLRGMGGEEIVVGVTADGGATRVSASTYMFDQQVARFLSTLPMSGAPASQNVDVIEETAESLPGVSPAIPATSEAPKS
jgi:hypothetical protein